MTAQISHAGTQHSREIATALRAIAKSNEQIAQALMIYWRHHADWSQSETRRASSARRTTFPPTALNWPCCGRKKAGALNPRPVLRSTGPYRAAIDGRDYLRSHNQ
jgi:hypothetical protein